MMTIRYGGKRGRPYSELLAQVPTQQILTGPGGFGRQYRYGSGQAERAGLVPVEDYPDDLVDPKDYKEVINWCNEKQIYPRYHLAETGIQNHWNQNGLPYCWAWGCAASVVSARAMQNLPYVRLAPVSLGWLVNWQNSGYYVDATLEGARERGIASAAFVPSEHNNNPNSFKAGWQEDALNYRPDEFWDTRRTSTASTIQQMITVMKTGTGGDMAYDWWSHALYICGLIWDESEENNIVVELLNSHADGFIELAGWRAIPDVFIGVRSAHFSRDSSPQVV
jgi:hypothetical protein